MNGIPLWQRSFDLLNGFYPSRPSRGAVRGHDHAHRCHEIGYVIRGEAHWILDVTGKSQRLRAGDFIWLKPGTVHREDIAAGQVAQLAFVAFRMEPEPEAARETRWFGRRFSTRERAAEVDRLLWSIFHEQNQSNELGADAAAGLALQQLIILLCRTMERPVKDVAPAPGLNERQERIARSAAQYLEKHLPTEISVAQVARYHSLCPAYFCTLFREFHGVSPREYRDRARLGRAMEMLKGDDSLKRIAEATGFVDSSHFCRWFRRATGQTPRDWARANPANAIN